MENKNRHERRKEAALARKAERQEQIKAERRLQREAEKVKKTKARQNSDA